jgi:hypothetical protein
MSNVDDAMALLFAGPDGAVRARLKTLHDTRMQSAKDAGDH